MRFTIIIFLIHTTLFSNLFAQAEPRVFLMGEASGSTDCLGTLYDIGGPEGSYKNNLDQTFTICPDDPGACLYLDLLNFDLEAGEDSLFFYAGENTNAPLLAALSRSSLPDAAFPIVSRTACVTVRFKSDATVTLGGFALNWNCMPASCEVSSVTSATTITSLPFDSGLQSTCAGAATFATAACTGADFINGPEYIFAYDAPGGTCLSLSLEGAAEGTGILVLNGLPDAPGTTCVAVGANGQINGADTRMPGRYYIIVANNGGCTGFSLQAESADCAVSPALADALCDPVNNCIDAGGEPVTFRLVNGFKDINLLQNINSGCWLGDGLEADYFWFTMEATADGKIGFIAGSKANASDLDLNIWGPFSADAVCSTPEDIIRYIEKNQPIRSSWSTADNPTGLADVHPVTGLPVEDDLDCKNGVAGGAGDDFVKRIAAKKGEVYVVLLNDWGNKVGEEGIYVDFSLSDAGMLDPLPVTVLRGDTAICPGASAQILLENAGPDIVWEDPTGTLSCTDCPNPVATPSSTTTYKAYLHKNCGSEEIEVTVHVLGLPVFPNLTVCKGEDFRIFAGPSFEKVIYTWQFSSFILGAEYLDQGDLLFTAKEAGTAIVSVNLLGGACNYTRNFVVTVLPETAPVFSMPDDNRICRGDAINIGSASVAGQTYTWSARPFDFSSAEANPQIQPQESGTYYLEVSNESCPFPSRDSISILVDTPIVVSVIGDTTVCQGQSLKLSDLETLPGVIYEWTGPGEFEDATRPDTYMSPESSGTFTLTAVNGTCISTASFELMMTPSAVEIEEGLDELRLCKGEALYLSTSKNPSNVPVTWFSSDGVFAVHTADSIRIQPTQPVTRYYTQLVNENCVVTDSIVVYLDSLPEDLSISPSDTTVCEGSLIILETPTYDPEDYPEISFAWGPLTASFESPDSLLNMVLTADRTRTITRETVNGACVETSSAEITVDTIPDISIAPMDTLLCYPQEIQLVVSLKADLEDKKWTPESGVSCKECLTPYVTPTAKTTYTFEGKAGECPVSVSTTIDVVTVPVFEFPAATSICPGETVTLNTRPLGSLSYVWTSTDPAFGTVIDPIPQVTPTETTTYFLSIKDPRSPCPPYETQVTITVLDLATVSLTASDDFICPGDQVTLKANVVGGTATDVFIWTDNFGNELNDTDSEVTVSPFQTTTYTLTYIQANRCESVTLSTTIGVDPIVNASITTDEDDQNFRINQGEKVVLTADIRTQNTGNLTLTWLENGVAIPGATGESIEVQPLSDDIVYTLRVSTPNGCESFAEVVFDVVEPIVEIPNAFTPNGDGTNDYFNYFSSGNLQLVSFEVFNRWGQRVYNNETPDTGWNGEFKGKPAPSDLYIYIIVLRRLDGSEQVEKGEVTLIR